MHQVVKIIFLLGFILVAVFFANFYGYISIPWLDVHTVPTYGSEVQATDETVNQAIEDELVSNPE